MIEKPYAERIRLLRTIVTEQKGALMLCDRIKIRNAEHFLECLNKAFDANEEGVVIKQEDSKYRPGQREKGGWFKMKPDVSDLNRAYFYSIRHVLIDFQFSYSMKTI